MTRPKKKSSPSKPSVLQSAWDAFYRDTEVEDLQALNAEGWKTIDQIALKTGRPRNTVDGATRKSGTFERRSAKVVSLDGSVRRTVIIRPKLKG